MLDRPSKEFVPPPKKGFINQLEPKKDFFGSDPKEDRDDLFGRNNELELLKNRILSNRIIVVKGHRLAGKSSLAKTFLKELSKDRKYVTIYIDMQLVSDEKKLCDSIIEGVKSTYISGCKSKELPDHVLRFYGLLKEQTTKEDFSAPILNNMEIVFKLNQTKKPSWLRLRTLLYELNMIASNEGKICVICMDEIQNILNFIDQESYLIQHFQGLLAFIHSDLPNIRLVLTASYSRLMHIVLSDKYENILKSKMEALDIKPFDHNQSVNFLLEGFRRLNIEYRKDWAETVEKVVGGITGRLSSYGKNYEIEYRNNPYISENLYQYVLDKTSKNLEKNIKSDLKIFSEYASSKEGDNSYKVDFLYSIIDIMINLKLRGNSDLSLDDIQKSLNKIGYSGDLKKAIAVFEDYKIVEKIGNEKVILIDPILVYNLTIMRTPPLPSYLPKEVDTALEESRFELSNITKNIDSDYLSQKDNIVFVGNKPVMNYVLAVVTQFNSGAKDVRIMARGRAISRAVDVVEVSRSRFLPDVTIKGIQISTETLNTDRGETNVSAIEITLHASSVKS